MEILFSYLPTVPSVYLLAFVSIFLIHIFYRYIENKWPEVYFSTSDKMSVFIALSPVRFVIFRFFPIVLTTTFVLAIIKDDYFTVRNRVVIGFLIGFVHAFRTDLIAIFKVLKNSKSIKLYANKWSQIIVHVFSTFLVVSLSIFAGYFSSLKSFQKMTPTWQGVVDNLWSSIITAGFIFGFYHLYSTLGSKISSSISSIDIYAASRKNISSMIFQEISRQSKIHNANENLAMAICIVENLQRPSWVRFLEKVKSFFLPRGTYGIMQVSSSGYISDKESVAIAIRDYLKDTKDEALDDLQDVVKKYNSDDRYVDMVLEVYRLLLYTDKSSIQ